MRFIIQSTSERITPHSELGLVGLLLEKTSLKRDLNNIPLDEMKHPLLSNSDIVFSMVGLLAQGKSDFEHIETHRNDEFFKYALNLNKVASSARLRQRLDLLAKADGWRECILREMALLPGKVGLQPSAIQLSSQNSYVPIDLDVSPFDNSDTKKEGVSRTYKGCDGFAPLMAYIGREGYGLHAELCTGSTHVQKDVPQQLKAMIQRAKLMTHQPLLLRMDAGNDSFENLKVCQEENIYFLVKHNLRKQSVESWLAIAQSHGEAQEIRDGQTRYTGKIKVTDKRLKDDVYQVFEVVETTIDRHGQILLIPEVSVNVYWTNLSENLEEIFALYHDHATCEQFHSELKTDLDLERLPLGKFATNDLVLCLGLLTYTILRIIGQESLRVNDSPLRKKVQRRRIRTVIKTLITLASKLVNHARRWYLRVANPAWLNTFKRLYETFA